LKSKNFDIKKKLEKIVGKDLATIVNSIGKAKRLNEVFGDQFTKHVSISISALRKSNIDNLI
ncbi:11283_t:CDS:1, partial [Racocetra fulgida]